MLQEVFGEDLVGAVVLEGDALANVPEEVGWRNEVDVEEPLDSVRSAADLDLGELVVDPAVGPGTAADVVIAVEFDLFGGGPEGAGEAMGGGGVGEDGGDLLAEQIDGRHAGGTHHGVSCV